MALEIEAQSEPEFKVKSGFPTLDKLVDGFVGGELITISGLTKNGKTLFAQSLTAKFTEQNEYPLWFSYEVTPKYFLKAFPELPLFYMPRRLKMNAQTWLLERTQEAFSKFHTRIIFIDHLHYLFDIAQARNPSVEIGTVIRRLKTFAVDNNYVIFLLCHTNKAAGYDKEVDSTALRDSSFIAQESDTVFIISRNTKQPERNEAKLLVDFHRRTGALKGVVPLIKVDGYLKEETSASY
jgi:replicative DNA helicase